MQLERVAGAQFEDETLKKAYMVSNVATPLLLVERNKVQQLAALTCIPISGAGERGGALLLLPGNNSLSELEAKLSTATATVRAVPSFKDNPGAFTHVVRATAWYYDAEYVIVDLAPSSGVLNMLVVLSSDALVMPVSPGIFSLKTQS